MRKLLFLIFVFILTKTSSAQITLEHTYDSASYNQNNQLFLVILEVDSYKYVRIYQDTSFRQMRFYNLDHSIWKTIDMSFIPPSLCSASGGNWYGMTVLYISQHLFNTDDSIEYMYIGNWGGCSEFTSIYNESGRLLFYGDSLGPMVSTTVPQEMIPIVNTPLGTKMILSHMNGIANVYSLGGILTNVITMKPRDGMSGFKISPTPASEFTQVDFSLPFGTTQAQIAVYDINGNKLKEYNVDSSFNDLIINNKDFPPGTYFFTLQSQNDIITRKQVVIH